MSLNENETPKQRADREQLQRLAVGCANALNAIPLKDAGIGFAVILFDLGDTGRGNIAYVSNGQRADMATALRELLEKLLIEGEAQAIGARRPTDA